MKPILFSVTLIFCSFLSSCNNKPGSHDEAEKDAERNTEATEQIKSREKLSPKLFNN